MCIDERRTGPRHQLTNTATRGITFVASWLQVYPLLSGLEGSLWLGGFRCALCFLAFRVECSQDPVGKGAQKNTSCADHVFGTLWVGWSLAGLGGRIQGTGGTGVGVGGRIFFEV